MTKAKVLICPYCGEPQPAGNRCRACGGLTEPLSRQATHNEMGPWYIRDPERPFQPGCSYETLIRLIERGQIGKTTVVRGPTTTQFWTIARRVPGIAHLFGYCHQCGGPVNPRAHGCDDCGAPFGAYLDRNFLGLPDIRPMPWEADVDAESVAAFERREAATGTEGGLSSFASDEELLDGRGPPVRPPGAAATGAVPAVEPGSTGRLSALTVPLPQAEPVQAAAPVAGESATTRALRRRLERQDRALRRITWLLVLAVVVIAVLLALQLGPSLSDRLRAGDDARAGPPPAPPPAVEPVSPTPDSSPPAEPVADAAQPDSVAPAPDPSAQPPPEVGAAMEQIVSLRQRVEDPGEPLDDRIAACRQALKVVDDLESTAPSAQLPPDVQRQRDALETLLEELEVEKYLGTP
jgi:hypothetical protein